MKYIDAECLKAEIERRIEEYNIQSLRGAELADIRSFITSLQQEQQETELEEAAAAIVLKKHPIMKDAFTMEMAFYEMLELVKAGYELGFNARKEDTK